jgi:hypothetical protein
VSTTVAPAECLQNVRMHLDDGRYTWQVQLYRDATRNGFVVLLCLDPDDDRSLTAIGKIAAKTARCYRGEGLDPVATTWVLHLPARYAPPGCGGVYSSETWEHLRLEWAPDGSCTERKPLQRPFVQPRLLDREAVEGLIGGAL